MSLQLQRKELEYRRVKTLAKKVVDERAEMERFFIEALDEVAERIKDSRQNYVKSTKTQYHAQMAAAAAGRVKIIKFSLGQFLAGFDWSWPVLVIPG